MFTVLQNILAGFITPMEVPTTPRSLLWILPISAVIATVYKAIKVTDIKFLNFTKQVIILFLTIVIFMIIAGIGLLGFTWLILE